MNVGGVTDLVTSGVNKLPTGVLNNPEGVADEKEDALALNLDNAELLKLANQTEAWWSSKEGGIKIRQNSNKAYYQGRQKQDSSVATEYPIAGNLIFEAEETFLPAALSKNPEPVVWSDNTKEGTAQARDVKTMLQYHADQLVLRRKLNRMTRQWSVYLIGALKHGWDKEIDDIMTETRDPRNFIFAKGATIDEYGDYRGSLLGERIPTTADKLIELFPKHAAYITIMVDGFLGTPVVYTEWRSDKYCFFTFKNKVLDKNKNEFFNYDTTTDETDEDGEVTATVTPGRNHFARPKMPYTFLSVFSLGEEVHDITGLIEQNIPNQNRITKRETQIDVNFDRSNNSIGLSGANFNEETAKQAATAMQKGNPILIPAGGPVSEAVARFPAPDVPAGMFTELQNSKNDLRTIFGTQGITAMQQDDDQTARGMILNQQYDNTRIGGGIGDALEQVADNVFNWWVQLYYVFYDKDHYASVLGQMKAVEYVEFANSDLVRRVTVSVAPNSMKPRDEVTEMNQALALWEAKAMDPKTLFTVLNFPDPQKTAEQVVLWTLDPQQYMLQNFPELAAKMASAMAPAAGGAAVPPEQANGEPAPPEGISAAPANAGLDQVNLPAVQ